MVLYGGATVSGPFSLGQLMQLGLATDSPPVLTIQLPFSPIPFLRLGHRILVQAVLAGKAVRNSPMVLKDER
jgi:hypothetical protein